LETVFSSAHCNWKLVLYDLLAQDILLTTSTSWTMGFVTVVLLPFAFLRSKVDFSFAIGLACFAVRSAVVLSCLAASLWIFLVEGN
jgi:hypothetical protein